MDKHYIVIKKNLSIVIYIYIRMNKTIINFEQNHLINNKKIN